LFYLVYLFIVFFLEFLIYSVYQSLFKCILFKYFFLILLLMIVSFAVKKLLSLLLHLPIFLLIPMLLKHCPKIPAYYNVLNCSHCVFLWKFLLCKLREIKPKPSQLVQISNNFCRYLVKWYWINGYAYENNKHNFVMSNSINKIMLCHKSQHKF
jgi:hypothetical protein